ncbi:D-ribose pyranase [Virgibacillus doumboii]|uniref:D-ribose pyranase n=1 Tax=Virgibacillus doumboii TaxID=2697503 RepID=UPI0013E0BD77|nr:D-ribose pyranase [Virgibacillus doumboii]
MKKSVMLNKELSNVIASMGHTDRLIVCDAGFPIPNNAHRVDLALTKDVPDIETVLSIIEKELIAEQIYIAEDVITHNQPLYKSIKQIYKDVDIEGIPHESILTEEAKKAKAIVRTGAYNPWGNVVIQSGVDVPNWFNKEGVVVPDYYKDKM